MCPSQQSRVRRISSPVTSRAPGGGAQMKVIAEIDDEEVIYRILSHLKLLSPGDGPRAPPRGAHSSAPSLGSNVPRELIYEPFLLTSASAAGTVPRRGQDLGSTTPGEARRWPPEPRS